MNEKEFKCKGHFPMPDLLGNCLICRSEERAHGSAANRLIGDPNEDAARSWTDPLAGCSPHRWLRIGPFRVVLSLQSGLTMFGIGWRHVANEPKPVDAELESPPIDLKLAAEIRAAQDHGRSKYGSGPNDFLHDDSHSDADWHEYIQDHNERAALSTPTDRRQHLVNVAGLAITAIQSFDRKAERSRNRSLVTSAHLKTECSALWHCNKCGHDFEEEDAAGVDVSPDCEEQCIACPNGGVQLPGAEE